MLAFLTEWSMWCDGAVWSARGRLYCCSCARLWGCSTLPSAPSTTPSVAHAKTPPTAKDTKVKVSHCPVTQSIRFSQWHLTLQEHSADQCRHWKKENEFVSGNAWFYSNCIRFTKPYWWTLFKFILINKSTRVSSICFWVISIVLYRHMFPSYNIFIKAGMKRMTDLCKRSMLIPSKIGLWHFY